MIPHDPRTSDAFARQFTTNQDPLYRVVFLQCQRESPGIVWRGLRPCLLDSPKSTAKNVILVMFELLGLPMAIERDLLVDIGEDGEESKEAWEGSTIRRRLRFSVTSELDGTHSNDEKARPQRKQQLILWIQPPLSASCNTLFTGIMIAWEHQMITYQSLAAWISTLGGGHFFCRHLTTAVGLAKLQRRIALLMGDYNMAYKCTINEAYSYIYTGMFVQALRTIDSVVPLNKQVDIHPLDTLIVNMCDSARLFCVRVYNASKELESSKTQQEAKTFDDFQRTS